jgi:hypothetical protein
VSVPHRCCTGTGVAQGQVRCRRNKGLAREKTKGGKFPLFFRTLQPTCSGFSERPEEKGRVRYRLAQGTGQMSQKQMPTREKAKGANFRCFPYAAAHLSRFLRTSWRKGTWRKGTGQILQPCLRFGIKHELGKHGDARGRKMLGCFYIRSVSVSPQRRALQSSCSSTPSLVDNLPI